MRLEEIFSEKVTENGDIMLSDVFKEFITEHMLYLAYKAECLGEKASI